MTTETESPAPLPISRPMPVARLSREEETPVSLAAEAGELAGLARFLDVAAVAGLAFEGRLAPTGRAGWTLTGTVRAAVEQSCVVTLEPVHAEIEAEIERLYLPAAEIAAEALPEEAEIVDDGPDAYGETLDPAGAVVEALALAIDPYPRSEGADFGSRVHGPPGEAPLTDEAARPFAGLAALRARLKGDA